MLNDFKGTHLKAYECSRFLKAISFVHIACKLNFPKNLTGIIPPKLITFQERCEYMCIKNEECFSERLRDFSQDTQLGRNRVRLKSNLST